MSKSDKFILITMIIGVYGLIVTMWLKPVSVGAQSDGHTHNAKDLFGVAKKGHSHVFADANHSHSIDKINGLDSRIRLIAGQCNRGIYGDC